MYLPRLHLCSDRDQPFRLPGGDTCAGTHANGRSRCPRIDLPADQDAPTAVATQRGDGSGAIRTPRDVPVRSQQPSAVTTLCTPPLLGREQRATL